MSVKKFIEFELEKDLAPVHLEVINDSEAHHAAEESESHFVVVAVSAKFEGAKLIDRHRRVNALVQPAFDAGLHALSLHLFTPAEWEKKNGKIEPVPGHH